jgi:Bifunctional DNA primase/polymerase, N-terminal
MNELLEAALDYARRGWPVFPLASRSKKPLKGSHGFHDATTETSTIQRWWFENPRANVAIAPNGRLAILDVDPRNDGLESIRGRELPPTPTVMTGGGGYHYFFDSAGRRLASSKPLPGVELIGSTGYVVAPPSVHPSGALYQWASELSFAEMPLAPMPAWLVEFAGARGEGGAPRRASSYDGPRRPVFIELVLPGCFWLRHCRDDAATLAEWESGWRCSRLSGAARADRVSRMFGAARIRDTRRNRLTTSSRTLSGTPAR